MQKIKKCRGKIKDILYYNKRRKRKVVGWKKERVAGRKDLIYYGKMPSQEVLGS